jgi:hypothetical protein
MTEIVLLLFCFIFLSVCSSLDDEINENDEV